MMISFKHGVAFLCMPKCASTSIEAVLQPYADIIMSGHPGIKHLGIREYQRFIKPLLARRASNRPVETFCVMRDPLDWANSWYRYRARRQLKKPSHPNHKNYTGKVSFDEFIEDMMSEQPHPRSRVGTQSRMLLDTNGEVAIDRVFDYAKLHEVSNFLSEKLGKDIRLPRINVSPSRKFSLDPEREQRFREFLHVDYALYAALP